MARRRYDERFVETILAEVRAGVAPLRDVLARHGIPERTYHGWRRRYVGSSKHLLERLRLLERERRALTRLAKRQEREIALLKELLGKPWRRLLPGEQPSDGQ